MNLKTLTKRLRDYASQAERASRHNRLAERRAEARGRAHAYRVAAALLERKRQE